MIKKYIKYTLLKEDLKKIIIPLCILIPYCIVTQIVFKTVCPFKIITGINCPGCGLTHSVIYFFMGKFDQSFQYNQSCLLWIISIVLFIVDRYIYSFKRNIVFCSFIISALATIIIYLIKIII